MKRPDLYYKLELNTVDGYKAILINENSTIKLAGTHTQVKVKDLKIHDVILDGCSIEMIFKTAFPFELNCRKDQYLELPSFLKVIDELDQKYPDDYWDLNSEESRKILQDNLILEVEKCYLGVILTDCFCIDYYSSGALCKGHYMNEKDLDLSVVKKCDLK